MKLSLRLTLLICLLLPILGCSGNMGSSTRQVTDHPSLIAESVIGVLSALGNELEVFNLPASVAGDCSTQNRFVCGVGGNMALMTTNWNLCTFATAGGNSVLSGGASLLYSSTATCNDALFSTPTSGSLVKTLPKGTSTFGSKVLKADQTQLLTHTDGQVTYKSTVVGGGTTVVFGATGRTVQISGIHREFLNAEGTRVYHHTLLSAWPHLNMTGSRAAGTRAVSGSLNVQHNTLLATAELSLSSITWGLPACNFPTSGTLTMLFTDAVVGTATLTFTGCGTATFVAPSGELSNITLTLNE